MHRAPKLFEDNSDARPSVLLVPTPQPKESSLIDELGQLLRKKSTNRNTVGSNDQGSGKLNVDEYNFLSLQPKLKFQFDSHLERSLFTSPNSASHIRRSLSSINSAKSFVYGSTFFGDKKFYADEFDFKSGPLHPSDRRKIRFGLKSIADFVTQLDLHHLKSSFVESDPTVEKFSEHLD